MVNNNFCESRNKAAALIKAGLVTIDAKIVYKPSTMLKPTQKVSIAKDTKIYVSRSAVKLLTAKRAFGISFEGLIALDIGASTGGFSEVMLEDNVKKVYAIDIGEGQLHKSIKDNPRVISFEKTNARYINRQLFPSPIDIIVCDVSFISLEHILPPSYDILGENGKAVFLIKPQFELDAAALTKKGVVKNDKLIFKALSKVIKFAERVGFNVKGIAFTGLCGEAGNKEYLLLLQKGEILTRINENTIDLIIKNGSEWMRP